ncbi:MAG: tetratricopeptide repeat protein [Myxococcota bacterium]
MPQVRNALLAVVSLLVFFAVLEGLLALVGVTSAREVDDPFAGYAPATSLFVEAPANPNRLVTRIGKRSIFNTQRFDRHKPANVYRIFCLGGSTTFGRPYNDATSFCGWLRVLLPIAAPARRWELINAGAIGYGSYRVAAVAEEIARYEPDALVVYTGHNEFLERQTYEQLFGSPSLLLDSRDALSRTRTYTALKGLVAMVRGQELREPMQRVAGPEQAREVLDQSIGPDAYERNDRVARDVMEHFRRNLMRIARAARAADAAAIFIVPASNLRDSSPFKSVGDAAVSRADQQQRDSLLAAARRDRNRGRSEAALASMARAVALDPRHADSQYLYGHLLYDAKRYREAAEAFRLARDEDICPLRAASPVLESIREVARGHGAGLVDFARSLERRSEHGIAGENYFFDHVHPTIEANRLIALGVIDALRALGVVEPDRGKTEAAIAAAAAVVEARVAPAEHARALASTSTVYAWAHKHEDAYRLARRAAALSNAIDVLGNAADIAVRLGRYDEALAFNRRLLEHHPNNARAHYDIARILVHQGEPDEAVDMLRRALALNPQLPGGRDLLASLSGDTRGGDRDTR